MNTLDNSDPVMMFALFDWLFQEQDLWKFGQLLNVWHSHRPSWWDEGSAHETAGLGMDDAQRALADIKALGDVATEALRRAKWQAVTPPVIDLLQLYGASIS